VEHNGKCITVFSAPNYCDQMGNKVNLSPSLSRSLGNLTLTLKSPNPKGAFITFTADCVPRFTQFEHVPHPPVKPMAYANSAFSI